MKSINVEELRFITELALEFRLSLKNICKYFKEEEEDNEAIQLLYYNEIIRCLNDNIMIGEFKYLVNETSSESQRTSERAFNISKHFYLKYLNVKKQNICGKATIEDVKKCLSALKHTDVEFKKIIKAGLKNGMTEEKAIIIAKYRIKHVISKEQFSKSFEIKRDTLTKWENLITNPVLKDKINYLNDYFYNTYYRSGYKSRVKK